MDLQVLLYMNPKKKKEKKTPTTHIGSPPQTGFGDKEFTLMLSEKINV